MDSARPIHRDVSAVLQRLRGLFTGLDPHDPAQWPALPRAVLCLAGGAVVVALLWLAWLGTVVSALANEQGREQLLRNQYRETLAQAVQLEAVKQRFDQEQQRLAPLEREWPSPAEMETLLSDIHRLGTARGLQFELLRPGPVTQHEHLAAWTVALRAMGAYHGIGLFAADIAQLPRAVSLETISLNVVKDRPGVLTLASTVRMVRLLEPQERSLTPQRQEHQP
jgi:type IV pilus assembly protein PilO